jgi:hypothetical protein
MRKLLLGFFLYFIVAVPAQAQGGFTTVTGTITDPNGVTWACGTVSAQLITAGGAAPTLNGGGFTTQTSPVQLGCPTIPGSGASGSFVMRLADSGVIVPSNTTWKFTFGTPGTAPPLGTGPQSFSYTTAINCSTNTPTTCTSNQLSISTPASALAPAVGGGGNPPVAAISTQTLAPCVASPTFTTGPTFITDFFVNLSCNVTSSTMAGPFVTGTEAVFTLTQDATGGRTFAWPAGFLNTPTLNSAASSSTVATFQFCGAVGNGNACPANSWQNTDVGPVTSSPNGATIYAWAPTYGLKADGKYICDAGITSGSNVVTSPATDRPFTVADQGKIAWASNAQCMGENGVKVPIMLITQGKICTNVTPAAHQISMCQSDGVTALNASNSCTVVSSDNCVFVWASDDSTAVQNAFNDAANNCGTLVLPGGGILLQSPPNNTTSLCPISVAGNDSPSTVVVMGQGPYSTMLLMSPSTTFGNSMFAMTGATIRRIFHDFGIASFSPGPAASDTKTGFSIGFYGSIYNVWMLNYFPCDNAQCSNNFTPIVAQGVGNAQSYVHDNILLNSGNTSLQISNGVFVSHNSIQNVNRCVSDGGATAGFNFYTENNFVLCGIQGAIKFTGSSGGSYSTNDNISCASATSLPCVDLNNATVSYTARNLTVSMSSTTTGPALACTVGATCIIEGEKSSISTGGGGTGNGITNGGTLTLRNTAISSAGGTGLSNSGTVIVKEGNTFSNGITNTGTIKGNGAQIICTNVTPVTVSANVATDQNLMTCSVPSQTLGWVGRTLKVSLAGVYSTPAASTTAVVVKIKLGSLTLGSWTSTALAGIQATNDQFNIEDAKFTVQTAGATASLESHGNLVIDLGVGNTVPDSTFADVNTATVGTVDLTATQTLQITIAFTVASGSNTATQRQLVVEAVN